MSCWLVGLSAVAYGTRGDVDSHQVADNWGIEGGALMFTTDSKLVGAYGPTSWLRVEPCPLHKRDPNYRPPRPPLGKPEPG